MSYTLEDIRKKIDALDDQIHDLLMQRADLIVDVLAAKKKTNTPIVQPAREAKMIRRLLKRHRGPLPEAAIVKIWRELVGAVSLLQTGIKVAVSNDSSHAYTWDMAKEYFGTVLPMNKMSAPIAAISAVREDEATFAVVPWPHDGETAPWWQHLMNREQDMRIVCAMPYGVEKNQSSGAQNRALIVSKTDYAPSGEDRSFIVLKIPADVSRTKLIEVFKELKLNVLSITTRKTIVAGDDSMHLVEVDDYLTSNDERLKKFSEKFENIKTAVIGGYPVPPIYKSIDNAKVKAEDIKKTAAQ
jgi:chorismate mutase / prephenate dehydratase